MSISFFVFRFFFFFFFCCFNALSYIVFILKIVFYKCDFIEVDDKVSPTVFSYEVESAPERTDLGGLRYCTTALAHSSLICNWNWIEYNYNNTYRSIFSNCPLSCVFINLFNFFFSFFLFFFMLFICLLSFRANTLGFGIRTCFLVNGRTVETVETVEQ